MPRFFLLVVLGALLSSCSGPQAPGGGSNPKAYRYAVPVAVPIPYEELQAEDGVTDGIISSPSTSLGFAAAEASGRKYVTLLPGQSVTVTAGREFDAVVARYSFPDSSTGGGLDGLLEVKAGSSPNVSLAVTSRYSWEYGAPNWSNSTNTWASSPSAGTPRHFWDESNLRLASPQSAGTAVVLTNPSDSGVTVLVDLVDLELVPAAVERPLGSHSFADYNPDATGVTDVTGKLQQALNDAQGGILFVPEGTYRIGSVTLGRASIQGAGLWRTRFVGGLSRLAFSGQTVHLADFAIFGETTVRNDSSDEGNGLKGNPGPDSVLERLWIEHKKCAFWVGNWGNARGPEGFRITQCRFRNLMADAVNLCSGTLDALVDNCVVRTTGDDGLAAWSPRFGGNPSGGSNTFAHNVVQVPWVASGISLYGGGPFRVVGNRVEDTLTTGSGIYVSANFSAWPFEGTIEVRDNLMIRAGAHESDPGGTTGAIRVLAADKNMTGAVFTFTDNTVIDPLESAVSIQGPWDVGALTFTGLSVTNAPYLADVKANAKGSAVFTNVSVIGSTSGWRNSGASFTLNHP